MPAENVIAGYPMNSRVLILPDGPNAILAILRSHDGLCPVPLNVPHNSHFGLQFSENGFEVQITRSQGRICSINDDLQEGYLVVCRTADGEAKRVFIYDRREGHCQDRISWVKSSLTDTWQTLV